MLLPVRGIAVGEIPKRVISARVIKPPQDVIKLDGNVGEIIDGVAYFDFCFPQAVE